MSKGHIFIRDPKNSHPVCWICGLKKEEHPFAVEHKNLEITGSSSRNKTKVSANKKRQRVNLQS